MARHDKEFNEVHEIHYDPLREERAERSRERRLRFDPCPDCGQQISIMSLKKHLSTTCPNRRVPCRNWELGCSKMVPLQDRARHENVDELLRPRSALALNGEESGCIELNCEDICPPWTAEFWVLKAPPLPSAKVTIKKVLKFAKSYYDANDSVLASKDILEATKKEMMSAMSDNESCDEVQGGEMSMEQSQIADRLLELVKLNQVDIRKAEIAKVDFCKIVQESSRAIKEAARTKLCSAQDIVGDIVIEDHINCMIEMHSKSETFITISQQGYMDDHTCLKNNDDKTFQNDVAQRLISSIHKLATKFTLDVGTSVSAEGQNSDWQTEKRNGNDMSEGKQKKKKKKKKSDKKNERQKRRTARKEVDFGASLDDSVFRQKLNEGLKGRDGLEILASSDKCKLCLGSGRSGNVGFAISEKGDFFAHADDSSHIISHREWFHVAYVACSPPKKRVTIYINGKSTFVKDGISCNLPMQRIFDKDNNFHGVVQEVRYWASARSQADIEKWMHRLLPESSTQHGLLGWWTFEEGKGKVVYDVTEQRYRSKIVGKGIKWSTSHNEGPEPPTPAWKEQYVCKVELRRARLARGGRNNLQYVDCPLNCGAKVMKQSVRFHTTYVCQNSEKHKPAWLQDSAKDLRTKLANNQYNGMQDVLCPLSCGKRIVSKLIEKHIVEECEYGDVKCSNRGCNLMIPRNRIESHEKFFCESDWSKHHIAMVTLARQRQGYPTPWRLHKK
eukprot:CAMPEP_0194364156 /NCGR_PEP_ID=MMETSP0174-20130528/12063_1 /TAXON_ID=216777 /ORGANISM="Proboscia alata, Strain PI-D3" /LENGTH=730 /DNA_ID=CAMNT_0039138031 /DNA_START=26 /DNA_END=2215 /DNA_ORIENTATION=+